MRQFQGYFKKQYCAVVKMVKENFSEMVKENFGRSCIFPRTRDVGVMYYEKIAPT